VIKGFRTKALKELFETGTTRRIHRDYHAKIIRYLDALNAATQPDDLSLPGFRFHKLEGRPVKYSLTITGNYRITFEWKAGDAINVWYGDYH